MPASPLHPAGLRPAGYLALVERYGVSVLPNWHQSYVGTRGTRRIDTTGGAVRETYLPTYWPGDSLGDHLEFALKYDGVHLGILASLFRAVDPAELTAFIQSKPTGKYARRLWFLYEFLTGKRLPMEDVPRGNYVDLLDPKRYYTSDPPHRARRQRINDNLLGDRRFCPTVRRTDTLRRLDEADLPLRCREAVASYSPGLLKRALSWLYTKETKSSFEIEHIKPSATRTERFVSLLQMAEHDEFCDKKRLIDLQNRIVDPRFRESDYRTAQNYVGEAVSWQQEKIHFAPPKPEQIPDLMAGLVASHQRMAAGDVSPVVHAAAIAYGFVFLHPFEDGNGRIHRFLIHNILGRRGFTPEGILFPVSAAMLKNPAEYDASLEAFSRPLMSLVEYSLDEEGQMVVHNETADWYRYIDMTPQAMALFGFIETTIETELVPQLAFLKNYDQTKAAIREIVDMPDRRIDLFIRLCLQNGGKVSATKRVSHFDLLADDEIERMEEAVQSAYELRREKPRGQGRHGE